MDMIDLDIDLQNQAIAEEHTQNTLRVFGLANGLPIEDEKSRR